MKYEPTYESPDALVGRTNGPFDVQRSFFQVKVPDLRGKNILKSTFYLATNLGPDCGTPIELWRTSAIGPKTSWLRQPRWLEKVTTSSPAAPCPLDFLLPWDVTPQIKDAVARGDEYITLGFKSADERTAGLRRIKTAHISGSGSPGIGTQYNTAPDPPSGLAQAGICGAAPVDRYVRTTTPALWATITDPDLRGGADRDLVSARFEWADESGVKIGEHVTRENSSGYVHCMTVPGGGLADGGTYKWRVRAENPWSYDDPRGAPVTGTDVSDWSEWRTFTVDTTAPAPPTITSSDFPANQTGGRVGLPGTFTFTQGDSTDVVSYEYELPPTPGRPSRGTLPVDDDGKATLTYIPVNTFSVRLTVMSVDRAGNKSRPVLYTFRPGPNNPPTVSSTTYPPGAAGGGVGVPGEFTFSANGVAEAATFRYVVRGETKETPVGADGTATVTITPAATGVTTLTVYSVTAAGNTLATTTYNFTVNG
ncbi:hypothetical protein [Sinosporangium siamense]|uniref:hypothetical protein n=1 Tax=Sinosporangium siamense TaxID=1367973 RepID=UPI00194FFCB5|nr:hypothetical protein [Sinosporangium siamense]